MGFAFHRNSLNQFIAMSTTHIFSRFPLTNVGRSFAVRCIDTNAELIAHSRECMELRALCVSQSVNALVTRPTTSDDGNASFSVNRLFVCNVCVSSFHRSSSVRVDAMPSHTLQSAAVVGCIIHNLQFTIPTHANRRSPPNCK